MEDDGTKKLKGVKSYSMIIVITGVLGALVAAALLTSYSITKVNKMVTELVTEELSGIAISNGELLDMAYTNMEGEIPTSVASAMLANVKIDSCSTSYSYLITGDGTIVYHPTESKIGTAITNSFATGLCAKIQSGAAYDTTDVVIYTYEGSEKYAAYYVIGGGAYVLVFSVEKGDINSPVFIFGRNILTIEAVVMILAVVLCNISGRYFAKRIKALAFAVDRTAELNLTVSEELKQSALQRDETGQIARAMIDMKGKLHEIVAEIQEASTTLTANAEELTQQSQAVADNSSDNSATSQQLAAGMEETASATETIAQNISSVVEKAEDISKLANEGVDEAKKIQEKAGRIEQEVAHSKEVASQTFAEVTEKSNKAIEQSKAVEKINSLASAIMEIASQTNLLALNASIEAARAGEAGRGFAVVAEEIGNLANQSAETVTGITQFVGEVHDAVDAMAECIETMKTFIGENVAQDYRNFTDISRQYNNDATDFETSLENIDGAISVLNQNITDIARSIEDINTTISEAAAGVDDIAKKTTDIVELTNGTYEMTEETTAHAEAMEGIVRKFTL